MWILINPIADMVLFHYEGIFLIALALYVNVILILIFLPFCYILGKSDPSKGIYACGAHSEFGMMSLLATDGVMGLQVLHNFYYSYRTSYVIKLLINLLISNCRSARIKT